MKFQKRTIGLIIYFILLLLPIYWMLNMSLRTNADISAHFPSIRQIRPLITI